MRNSKFLGREALAVIAALLPVLPGGNCAPQSAFHAAISASVSIPTHEVEPAPSVNVKSVALQSMNSPDSASATGLHGQDGEGIPEATATGFPAWSLPGFDTSAPLDVNLGEVQYFANILGLTGMCRPSLLFPPFGPSLLLPPSCFF